MAWIIGIDEAGYGPTLGPLVMTAVTFQTHDSGTDLRRTLSPVIGDAPGNNRAFVVADSKKVHQAAKGIRRLEESVLPFLQTWCSCGTTTSHSLCRCLDPTLSAECDAPWHEKHDKTLPLSADSNLILKRSAQLDELMQSSGIALASVETRVIEAGLFNERVHTLGNKSRLLFQSAMSLVISMLNRFPHGQASIAIDKQGGRHYYANGLHEQFPLRPLDTLEESPRNSTYLLREQDRAIRIGFLRKGDDRRFEIALASMISKYLREIRMHAFNTFWGDLLPGLKPTAGYPEDAVRFLADIRPVRSRVPISDDVWIRSR